MFKLLRHNQGQAVFEYAIILGIVVLALGMMQTYLRRGIQAGIKVAADEIGLQQDSVELEPAKGTTEEARMHSRSSAQQRIQYGRNGAQELTVQEKEQVLPMDEATPSHSKYWSNWEEK